MKKLISLIIILIVSFTQAQQKFTNQFIEKAYIQLNNVLFQPGETVFFKIFVTDQNNQPLSKSDFVYVDVFDASNKKIQTQQYLIKNGGAEGSFNLNDEISGLNKLVVYTSLQNQSNQNTFEKTFFVQKVHAPNLIMSLDFKKKAYGNSDICEADFSLKTNQNEPIRFHNFKYDIFLNGHLHETKSNKTNEKGESLISFQLPNDLTSTDGIINVKISYDNQEESVTRSIPIKFNHIDLQFLPEGGHYILGQQSKIYFIAKDENGLPLDCKGHIYDGKNEKIAAFESFHDGMGEFSFIPINDNYYAIINSPFESKKIDLPKPSKDIYSLSTIFDNQILNVNIHSPEISKVQIIIRNQAKIVLSKSINLSAKQNKFNIDTKDFPTGTYAISLLKDEKIVAEKLFFNKYQENLKINFKTDKNVYQPREQVDVLVETLDVNNKPVSSHLAVSVINEKTLAFINDKQHTILSWFLFGHEVKGKIHEPNFYFNPKEDVSKRQQALDLLLNTHGWRKFHQSEINNMNFNKEFYPETINATMGYVVDAKNKPVRTKVYMITDDQNVYETKTDETGYFIFKKINYSRYAYVVAESKSNNKYQIILAQTKPDDWANFVKENAISNPYEAIIFESYSTVKKNSTTSASSTILQEDYEPTSLSLNASNALEEVVIVDYNFNRRNSALVSVIKTEDITANLQGKLTGVNVISSSGNTGADSKVLIRGGSSLYGNSTNQEPLYIVDGIPISKENFSAIDQNNIMSINVLKGMNATSLYGVGASNGVIVIRTKNTKSGIILSKKSHYVVEYLQSKKQNIGESALFYIPNYKDQQNPEIKDDFRSCIYWNKTIQTDKNGQAKFSFYNSDEVTSFAIIGEGISALGHVGHSKHNYAVLDPIEIETKLPIYASVNDEIVMPVRIKNNTNQSQNILIKFIENDVIKTNDNLKNITLNPNESTSINYLFSTNKSFKNIPIVLEITQNNKSFKIEKTLDIYSVGFPKSISFSGHESTVLDFNLENMIENTLETEFSIFNNRFEMLTSTLDKMLREPHGCFEQVSSTNYPNIMIVKFLENQPSFRDKKNQALQILNSGYRKLANYKSKDGGYEWYGGNPGNEALTAYGLLQFYEMRPYVDINENEFNDMKKWLLSRRDNKGGFNQVSGRYGFSGIHPTVNNAYITYVLSEIGEKNIDKEFQTAFTESLNEKDNYKMALMALTAFNLNKKSDYQNLMNHLNKQLETKDLQKIKVGQTVVNSYGQSKQLEFLALYGLALLKNKTINSDTQKVLKYIESSQTSYGFGSTQSNALCLKFIINYLMMIEEKNSHAKDDLMVNNHAVNLSANSFGNVVIKSLDLKEINQIKIVKANQSPYALIVNFQSSLPENSPQSMVLLKTTVPNPKVKINDVCRINVELINTKSEVLFNPLVRIGIPGGLSPEPWQLKELIDKNIIDYYEIINNELVLYFREINAKATKTIILDFKAIVAGKYKGKASSAYLYYNIEHKHYNEGIVVEVK